MLEFHVIGMKKKTQELALENDLLVDLTFHSVCLPTRRVCRKNRQTLLQWQHERCHPRPTPQNPRRTRIHPIPYHPHSKRGDIMHGQNRSFLSYGFGV